MMKRTFDAIVSFLGLVLLSPFLLPVAIFIKLDSPGPVLFRQERIGKGFRPFFIFKFRTMLQEPFGSGRLITIGDDPRITRVGRWLRKTKIDEVPQLINVLKGDMSLVGPRPEVARYVQAFQKEYEEILKVRPGITDLASLKYRNEEAILGQSDDPEEEYVKRVLPEKIKLAKEYIRQSSLLFNITVIFQTLLKVFNYKLSH